MKPIGTAVTALVGAGVLGVVAATGIVYSGVFNVGATVQDAAPLYWLLATTRENSIQKHAKDIVAPTPGGQANVERGFAFFRQECAMCHTPPGRQPTMMSKGLNPAPPPLAGLIEDMSDEETFWVTENGIRFTGMPSWARTHNEQDIWDVVWFMRSAKEIEAAAYDELDKRIAPIQMN